MIMISYIVPPDHNIATTLGDKHMCETKGTSGTFSSSKCPGTITQKRLLCSLVLSLFPAPFVESSE